MLLTLFLSACSSAPRLADAGATTESGATYTFILDAGAFPPSSRPSVLVYAPRGFRLESPLRVVVWLHGIHNCIENVVRDQDGECTPDAGTRSAHHLKAQLEASGRNVLLVVPELGFDALNGAPGNLARPNGARALLAETLVHLRPVLGRLTIDDLAPLVIAAHSAGYEATAGIVEKGGLPVAEIWHLDSLYGEIPVYATWIESRLPSFEGIPARCRFADVYTHEWGTEDNSLNMAEAAESIWFPDAGAIIDDRTVNDLPDAALHHGLVFKRSALSHDDVARVWFGRLLSTSNLP